MEDDNLNVRTIAEQIFIAGVESVLPGRLIHQTMTLEGNCLKSRPYWFFT